jgi:hypothetical protein
MPGEFGSLVEHGASIFARGLSIRAGLERCSRIGGQPSNPNIE